MKLVPNGLFQEWKIRTGLQKNTEKVRGNRELLWLVVEWCFNNMASPPILEAAMLAVWRSIPLL